MARKLKTFQTSLGFYDLAIAAPSLKVTLEACDVQSGWMISDRRQTQAKGSLLTRSEVWARYGPPNSYFREVMKFKDFSVSGSGHR